MGTISTNNQSYTQQDINTQLYAEATPPDTTYSRLTRDDKKTEEIATVTYDYADPNQIREEYSQATNPPTVSGEAIPWKKRSSTLQRITCTQLSIRNSTRRKINKPNNPYK